MKPLLVGCLLQSVYLIQPGTYSYSDYSSKISLSCEYIMKRPSDLFSHCDTGFVSKSSLLYICEKEPSDTSWCIYFMVELCLPSPFDSDLTQNSLMRCYILKQYSFFLRFLYKILTFRKYVRYHPIQPEMIWGLERCEEQNVLPQ